MVFIILVYKIMYIIIKNKNHQSTKELHPINQLDLCLFDLVYILFNNISIILRLTILLVEKATREPRIFGRYHMLCESYTTFFVVQGQARTHAL